MAYNDQHLLAHSFCGAGIWEQLNCWLWLGVSHGDVIKLSAGVALNLMVWLGLEELLLMGLTHLAPGRRPWFLATYTSPWDCLSILTTWRLASPKSEWSKSVWHGESYDAPDDLASEVMLRHFCHMLFIRSMSLKEAFGNASQPTIKGREVNSISWKEECQRILDILNKPDQDKFLPQSSILLRKLVNGGWTEDKSLREIAIEGVTGLTICYKTAA